MTGEQIKELRFYNNLSQHDFAKLIGTTQKTVSQWERNETKIGFIKLRAIDKKIKEGVLQDVCT